MLNIRTIYYTAGTQYDWLKDGYSMQGIGIKWDYLLGEGVFRFETCGQEWEIDKKKAREFIGKYTSTHNAHGTILGVLPISILEKKQIKNVNQLSLI